METAMAAVVTGAVASGAPGLAVQLVALVAAWSAVAVWPLAQACAVAAFLLRAAPPRSPG